ncbi:MULTISPECIES: DUF2604 domain-containing protein [unclassified Mesorhizobium]|uniref:DUF2604 domain-containing protein n=1 Tax=unclassified Mesorhizobium TaxID=325217 RepID=UPI001FEF7FE3|nr:MULTISPECIES: DUF2604 domain-containing protein [unclassified Mesorhizobium]
MDIADPFGGALSGHVPGAYDGDNILICMAGESALHTSGWRDKYGSLDSMGGKMKKSNETSTTAAGQATGSKNKITLIIVVNGDPASVDANVNAPLHTVIGKALEMSGNVGQPPENWELKDAAGNVLDASKKVEDLGLVASTKLFLSLRAGAAG